MSQIQVNSVSQNPKTFHEGDRLELSKRLLNELLSYDKKLVIYCKNRRRGLGIELLIGRGELYAQRLHISSTSPWIQYENVDEFWERNRDWIKLNNISVCEVLSIWEE